MDEERWVLVGTLNGQTKVIGPFDTGDEARETCNGLGMPEVTWDVVPLIAP